MKGEYGEWNQERTSYGESTRVFTRLTVIGEEWIVGNTGISVSRPGRFSNDWSIHFLTNGASEEPTAKIYGDLMMSEKIRRIRMFAVGFEKLIDTLCVSLFPPRVLSGVTNETMASFFKNLFGDNVYIYNSDFNLWPIEIDIERLLKDDKTVNKIRKIAESARNNGGSVKYIRN